MKRIVPTVTYSLLGLTPVYILAHSILQRSQRIIGLVS